MEFLEDYMDILTANEHLDEANRHLLDDPEYQHWFEELVMCRKEAYECGYDIGKLEGILYQLHIRDIGCIIEGLKKRREA